MRPPIDQELGEAEPTERESGGDANYGRESKQIHRNHHGPLLAEFDPRTERHRHPHHPPRGGQGRHRGRPGVQHDNCDQGKRVEREPRPERADRKRCPEPLELPPQRPLSVSAGRVHQTFAF
jgi:hypothetical protein